MSITLTHAKKLHNFKWTLVGIKSMTQQIWASALMTELEY